MPDISVPPHMPLVPFKLLPHCWSSEGVSLNKFVCGYFKRNCLRLQKFLPSTQSLLVFAARSYGDFSSWHWNLGWGGVVWGYDSLPPELSLPNFYLPHVHVGQACSASLPLLLIWKDVISFIT